METLFPKVEGATPPNGSLPEGWSVELEVSREGEIVRAAKRLRLVEKAPGLMVSLAAANVPWASVLKSTFTELFRTRRFPQMWRRTNLVFLSKEGRPTDSLLAYQPVCLLDEAAKLFERMLVDRFV